MFMSSIQVRINENTHNVIKGIAREIGESMQSVVEHAVERYKRDIFLENLNRDFDLLRNNEQDWASELEERDLWAVTMNDGEEVTK